MNPKLTIALLAGMTCVSYSTASAAIASPTTSGPTTTTAPANAAPQPLSGTNAVNGTASGMMNAPASGSTTQTINRPGVTTRTDLTTGRVGSTTATGTRAAGTTDATTAAGTTNAPTAAGTTNAPTAPGTTGNTIGTTPTTGTGFGSTTATGIGTSPNRQPLGAPATGTTGTVGTTTTTTTTRPPTGTGVAVAVPQNVGDQGTNAYDAAVTRQIRERITRSDLSMNARNVKIITLNGQVVLRGPVDSSAEASTIERIATDIVGSHRVKNETTIR